MTETKPEEPRNRFSTRPLAVPEGYEEVHRWAPIRLGPGAQLDIHDVTNHSSKGITSISVDGKDLVVKQDWSDGELIGYATASVDFQLAKKGVIAGISGGAGIARISICRPSNTIVGYYTQVPPNNDFFGELDNLWYYSVSLRPIQ
jgi:hypothetical protein